MNTHGVTRRDSLKAGLTAALALAGPGRAQEAPPSDPPASPVAGVSTLGFPEHSNAALARELAQQGITTVQLFLNQSDSRYWKYNGRTDLSDLGPERCTAIGRTYQDAGLTIHSIGVYTNLIHPDEAERKANLAYFDQMMAVGAAMNVHTFVTEAGHYDTCDPLPFHFQEPVWRQMVATGRELAKLAQDRGATVLLESYFGSFFASAKRTRVYIEEIGSPHIRALLDPANILEINDLEEMFLQLGSYIDCLHAKDRKLHVERGVAAGQGDLDYPKFVALAAQHAPNAPFILEYVGPDDYLQALAHLQQALDAQ